MAGVSGGEWMSNQREAADLEMTNEK